MYFACMNVTGRSALIIIIFIKFQYMHYRKISIFSRDYKKHQFCTLKKYLQTLCGGRNYQSDPHVVGTTGKVLKRPFEWGMDYPSIKSYTKLCYFEIFFNIGKVRCSYNYKCSYKQRFYGRFKLNETCHMLLRIRMLCTTVFLFKHLQVYCLQVYFGYLVFRDIVDNLILHLQIYIHICFKGQQLQFICC